MKPTKVVVDLSKPKGQRETVVELTDKEIAERKKMIKKAKEQEAAEKDKLEAEEKARASAKEKLAALGLSEEEVNALIK